MLTKQNAHPPRLNYLFHIIIIYFILYLYHIYRLLKILLPLKKFASIPQKRIKQEMNYIYMR